MIYHNRSSTDFGIFLNYPEPYMFAQREFQAVHVPGRSGDIIEDNGAFQNPIMTVPFEVVRPQRYTSWFSWNRDVAEWLDGYNYSYLKFSYQDDYVWEAYLNQAPTVTPTSPSDASGTFSFTVKPYLIKASGTLMTEFPLNQGNIFNHESIACYPDWKFTTGATDATAKSFTLKVNDKEYNFNGVSGTVFVDGENCQVSNESGSINSLVQFANNDTPRIEPGENSVTLSGDSITKMEWRPKWRCKA